MYCSGAMGVVYCNNITNINADGVCVSEWMVTLGSLRGRPWPGGTGFDTQWASRDTSLLLGQGWIVATTEGNHVHGINMETEEEEWIFDTGGLVRSSPVLDENGRIYFGCNDGNIYCLNLTNGTEIWSYNVGTSMVSDVYLGEDALYIGADDGYVYALDNGVHIETSTRTVSVPEQSTNTFQLRLTGAPVSGSVTVDVAWVSGDTDVTVQSESSLVFNGTTWSNWQTVTVAAALDYDPVNGAAQIECSSSGFITRTVTAVEEDSGEYATMDVTNLEDTYVQEGSETNYSTAEELLLHAGTSGSQKSYIRYDLSSYHHTVTNAAFKMTVSDLDAQDYAFNFRVYGLNNGVADENWNPSTITYSNAPAFDAAGDQVDLGEAVLLGAFDLGLMSTNDIGTEYAMTEESAGALTSFLNADTNDLATFIIVHDSTEAFRFAASEHSTYAGPRLTVQGVTRILELETSVSELSVREGSTNSFTVRLTRPPTDEITVSITRASGDDDLKVESGAALVFAATNWNDWQTVVLSASKDSDTRNGSAVFDVATPGVTTIHISATESDTTDGTALEWNAGYPRLGTVSSNAFDFLAEADDSGVVYYVLLPNNAPEPSSEQVKSGQDASAAPVAADRKGQFSITADVEASDSLLNLSTGTAYDLYVVAEDTSSNLQSSPAKIEASIPYAAGYTNPITYLFDFGEERDQTSGDWNNVTAVTTGVAIVNAVDENGIHSDVSLEIMDDFNNASGAGVDTNILYPTTAQGDLFRLISANPQGAVRLSGLDTNAVYDITLFGSFSGGDKTLYMINDAWKSLVTEDNISNSVTFVSIIPTTTGTVDIVVDRDESSGGLGVLEVTRTFDHEAPLWDYGYPVVSNYYPTKEDLALQANEKSTAYYVVLEKGTAEPSSAQVKAGLDGNNVQVDAVHRGSFALDGASESSRTISNLVSDLGYDAFVVAEDMKANIQATPTRVNMKYFGPLRVLIDLGGSSRRASGNWNHLNDVAAGVYITNAIAENGMHTSVGVEIVDAFNLVRIDGIQTNILYPTIAQQDYFRTTQPEEGLVRLTGLDTGTLYRVTLFASGPLGDSSESGYTIGSITQTLLTTGNTSNTVVFTDVSPDTNGWIEIDVDKTPGQGRLGVIDLAYGIFNRNDTDGDGLPDSWETNWFGNLEIDPGNMASNGINTVREAYIANLDPTSPTNRFRISELSPLNSEPILRWNSTSGRVYSVYWSSNLLNGFVLLSNNVPWTTSVFTDKTHNAESKGFYKIEVEME